MDLVKKQGSSMVSVYTYDCACGFHHEHRRSEPVAGKCHFCRRPISWQFKEVPEHLLPPEGVRADVHTVFDVVAKWVSDDEEIDKGIKEALINTMDNKEAKLRVLSTAFAMEQADRLRRVLKISREVESELLNPGRIATSSTKELTAAWATASNVIDSCIDYLEGANKKADVDARSVHFHMGDNSLPGTVESRELVRGIVEDLVKTFASKQVEVAKPESSNPGT